MEVRRLTPADVDAFIALRRRSLDDAPLSFAASAEDDRATDREHVLRQLSNQDQAMLGAFDSALITDWDTKGKGA